MTASWALTGPQFLGVYLVTYLLALALMYGFRAVLTHEEADAENPRPLLDPYETAYLAGGPDRTVSAAIANLALSDRLLVSRGGALTLPAGVALDDVDAAVAAGVSTTRRRKAAMRRLRKHPHVMAIGDRLRARGLLLDGASTSVLRACVLLPCAVWAVGLIRLINGIELHHKVILLSVFLVATGLSTLALVKSFLADAAHRPSAAGQLALQGMKNRYESGVGLNEPATDTGQSEALRQAQVVGVALLGFAALTDDDLRTSLLGSAGVAGGGGCGGGTSCGGCGGGGCGGCGGCGG
ncbi:TIGR04222 domain-containing membrane protein [Mycolicibacterium sp. lyk4-40-TYG-92]|uniref:TIGR04222 domain-containing membrane protein n=1 Tax=Mycolicibacterium sp. lyk4-40-TYG-92 TaxID=3040295 RepID=UPI00254C3F29|nr:TIGR04222 domain-containing membrane protein [Mycolicibacterium sp. lyk4-40-TYG-92]